MKDKMSISDNNHPPKEFTEYLYNVIEEIIVKGESFDKHKKWLKKYCDEYGVDYSYIETEISDFTELFNDYSKSQNSLILKMLYKSADNVYLSKIQIDTFVKSINKKQKTKVNKTDSGNTIQSSKPIVKKDKNAKQHLESERYNDINTARNKNSITAYNSFLKKYKTGKYTTEARNKIAELRSGREEKERLLSDKDLRYADYLYARSLNTKHSYQSFIAKYKTGAYIIAAKDWLNSLNTPVTPVTTSVKKENDDWGCLLWIIIIPGAGLLSYFLL